MSVNTTPGDSAADSYADVSSADNYAARHGLAWDGDEPAKEAALRRATQWLDGTFAKRFPGRRANGRAQALQWPRVDAYADDGSLISAIDVPPEIASATIEAAARELAVPHGLVPDFVADRRVTGQSVGEISVEYASAYGPEGALPILTKVEHILQPILRSNGDTRFLGRA